MKLVLFAACLLATCHAQSVKSCGTSSDILQNAVFTVSPDPIVKTSPLTITATGTLSANVVGGSIAADLNVKALGIINEPIKSTSPFTLAPGIAAGDTKVVIGPFTLPSIPGSVTVSGTVKGTDASGKEIFCVALDVTALSDVNVHPMSEVSAAPVASNCGASTDHLKNVVLSSAGGVTSIAGTLDEDVSTGNVPIDLTVQASFIKIPIKTTVPFSISPAIPKGDVKASIGPAATDSNIVVKVDGTIKINDGTSAEIACIQLTTPSTFTLLPEFAQVGNTTNTAHYEDPKPNGCQSDELAIQIQGITGDFCSPKCAGSTCPTDVPSGTTATPQCALQDQSGNKYCALICSPSANDSCGTATCKSIQGTGICTYDDR